MLVAIGIGPGDPELLTIKAVNLIKNADAVFVPGNVAKEIISPYRQDIKVLSFPMTDDEDYIKECMHKNAEIIAPVAESGLAVFCILGDPNFYGTFGRLCEIIKQKFPSIEYSTIPGISSITAFASATGISVNGGIFITDGSLENSRILLKIREPRKIIDSLKKEGFKEFVLAEKMYMKDQKIYRNDEIPEKSAYFSVMFARK
ncbi:MAG: cobalt-factor II C(20)-methyltransferase [Methanomicrobiaceae archaeon]|nr:cobalt-factor II C(20)-methyltransferase [Methanomicrobiaceae archaeon]